MCLVKMAQRCLQLAQTLCKLMDLQADPLQKPHEAVVDDERINIAWCMSILGTSVSFPWLDQSYDHLHIPLPTEQPENPARRYFIANIRLAQLRARIQQNLFGSHTQGPSVTTTQNLAVGYLDELQRFQASLGMDDSFAHIACLPTDFFQLAIHYSIRTTRVMIHELFPSNLNGAGYLADAQSAVGILVAMGNETNGNVTNHALLPRYGVPYFVLFHVVVTDLIL